MNRNILLLPRLALLALFHFSLFTLHSSASAADVSLSGQSDASTIPLPAASTDTNDLGSLLHGGVWYKWSIANQYAYWTAQLPFLPNSGTLSGVTWGGSIISGTYGGTGISTASSTGFPTITAGTWSIVTSPAFAGTVSAWHLIGNTAAPSITLPGSSFGGGSTGTVTLDAAATDLSGTLTLTTGGTMTGSNATIVTFTFAHAYGNAPHFILSPSNALAAALNGTTQVFCIPTTTTLVLKTGSGALTGSSSVYVWSYFGSQ